MRRVVPHVVAVGDAFAETERQRHHPILAFVARNRIVIERAGHGRQRRVETSVVTITKDLLDHHCHLLSIVVEPGSSARNHGAAEECGCPGELQSPGKSTVTRLEVFLGIGDHLGCEDSGERSVVHILEIAGGSNRQRIRHHAKHVMEIFPGTRGQLSALKLPRNPAVGEIFAGDLPEAVTLHEGGKDIRGDHHRLRDGDRNSLEVTALESRQDFLSDLQ